VKRLFVEPFATGEPFDERVQGPPESVLLARWLQHTLQHTAAHTATHTATDAPFDERVQGPP